MLSRVLALIEIRYLSSCKLLSMPLPVDVAVAAFRQSLIQHISQRSPYMQRIQYSFKPRPLLKTFHLFAAWFLLCKEIRREKGAIFS